MILNAALRAGLDLPYGCRMASCGTCACRVVEGEVSQADQDVLTEDHRREGYFLPCSSTPRSNLVFEPNQVNRIGI